MKIYCIGRPQFDEKVFSQFLNDVGRFWKRSQDTTESEEIAEIAGRICYMSFGQEIPSKENKEFLQEIIINGHESILEHITWTFIATGISRSFTHQLVRHRVGFSFSQLSQQYCDQTEAIFVEPKSIKNIPYALEIWKKAVETTKKAYHDILETLRKVEKDVFSELERKEIKRAIRSVARSILPNATETKVVMSANARALRHFLKVRGAIPGDEEMRSFCVELLKILKKEAPSLFFDFEIEMGALNTPQVIHKNFNCQSKV